VSTPGGIGATGDRYEREASFHDRQLTDRTREGAWRYYDIAADAYEAYRSAVTRDVQPQTRVLEYGCGSGSAAFDLARLGAEVHGIDIAPGPIEAATRRAASEGVADRTSFHVMNAERLEFAPASFDLVCGTSVLHHLDVTTGYRQVARVLAPGGRAVFLEPLGHNPAINLYRRLTPALRTPDEHPLTLADLHEARRWFGRVELRWFTVTGLLAAGLEGTRAYEPVLGALRALDGWMLRRVPLVRRWAWIVVIDATVPVPEGAGDRNS